jgi:cysteine desulfurase
MEVFLDNCSTTPLSPVVKQAIIDNLDEFGNPSSVYELGRRARVKIEESREKIAELINADPGEILFTSGATESNNWVLSQSWYDYRFISNIEHPSIYNLYDTLHCINVDKDGIVRDASKKPTTYRYDFLTSIMMVNNELGTINSIKELCETVHKNGGKFHCDLTQAIPHMRVDIKNLAVDTASFSAHKFNGPKGVGVLFEKQGYGIDSLVLGGGQEFNKRAGTENVLGIIAMAVALEDTMLHMDETNEKITYLSALLEENILNINGVYDNVLAPRSSRIPGVYNLRIDGCNGADLVALASEYGICISAGSACHSGNPKPSHVLKAIGLTDEQALSSVRISIGRFNGEQNVKYFCELFPKIIEQLRFVGV